MSYQQRFRPLDPDEARKFEKCAEEHDDFLTSLTGRALIMLGLRPIEYTHTLSEWIERRGSRLMYSVKPYGAIPGMDGTCIQGSGSIGQANSDGRNLYNRGKPCAACRGHKEDNSFLGKSDNAPRDWVLSSSPELEQLGKDFEWWFQNNRKIPFNGEGVRRRVRDIAEKANLGDTRGYKELSTQGTVVDINPYDLRHTYGTRLARMEYEPYEIMDQMGHGSINMPKTYISFTGIRKEKLMDEKWDSNIY